MGSQPCSVYELVRSNTSFHGIAMAARLRSSLLNIVQRDRSCVRSPELIVYIIFLFGSLFLPVTGIRIP